MGSEPSRLRPLAVQRGDVQLFLSSADVSLLVDAIGLLIEGMMRSHGGIAAHPRTAEALQSHIQELEDLRREFSQSSGSFADPPLELDRNQARLLCSVLGDITGYQRGELSAGLRQLRGLVSDQ